MAYKASAHPKYDSNVKNIQRNLNELRPLAEEKFQMSLWAPISEDGYYGNGTAAAVKGFQQAFKCTPYDGIYGNQTDAALKKALSDLKGAYCAVPIATSINGGTVCSSSSKANQSTSAGMCTTYETSSVVGDNPPVDASINNSSASAYTSYQDYTMTETKITSGEAMSSAVNSSNYLSEIQSVCDKLGGVFSTLFNGLNASIDTVGSDLQKLSDSWLADLFGNVKKAAESFYNAFRKVINAASSALSSAVKILKETAQKFFTIAYTNMQVSKAIMEQKIASAKEFIGSLGDKAKKHCSKSIDKIVKIVKDEMLSAKINLAFVKSRLSSALNLSTIESAANSKWYKGINIKGLNIKGLGGIPGALLNFVGVFVLILTRDAYSESEWKEEMSKAMCQAIDGLLLGMVISLLTKVALLAIFGSAAATATGGVVVAIGIAVSCLVMGIYYVVAGKDDVTFTNWVLQKLDSEVVDRSLTFYTNEKARSGGCL